MEQILYRYKRQSKCTNFRVQIFDICQTLRFLKGWKLNKTYLMIEVKGAFMEALKGKWKKYFFHFGHFGH